MTTARQEILQVTVARIRHLCDQIEIASRDAAQSQYICPNTGVVTERAVLRLGDLTFIAIESFYRYLEKDSIWQDAWPRLTIEDELERRINELKTEESTAMFYCPACGARSEFAHRNLAPSPPELALVCHACHLLSAGNKLDTESHIRKHYPEKDDAKNCGQWLQHHRDVICQWLTALGHNKMWSAELASYLEGHLFIAFDRGLTEYETLLRDVVTAWRTSLPSGAFDSSNMDRLVVRICRRVGIGISKEE
jgi:hypothetical protein